MNDVIIVGMFFTTMFGIFVMGMYQLQYITSLI